MNKKNLDHFFEIIESDLKKRKRFLTILAIIVGILLLLPLKSFLSGGIALMPSQLYSYVFIILCTALMFGVGFYSLYTKLNFYKRKDFQWFIHHPENVKDYKIIAGDIPKIELNGIHQKTSFTIKAPLSEAERRLFVVFPQWNPAMKKEVNAIYNRKETNSKERLRGLLDTAPKELKSYFLSIVKYPFNYIVKKWFSAFLSTIISIASGLSVYSYFSGVPDFFIFGYRNLAFYLFIWIGPGAVLYIISDYLETKKWLRFFQKDTSDIVGIYTSESKNSINGIPAGKTYGIYIANSHGKRLHIPIMSYRLKEVYEWLNLYFERAVTGYLHQYEDMYRRSPEHFNSQVINIRDTK